MPARPKKQKTNRGTLDLKDTYFLALDLKEILKNKKNVGATSPWGFHTPALHAASPGSNFEALGATSRGGGPKTRARCPR